MKFFLGNEEMYHINLSRGARKIIDQDRIIFSASSKDGKEIPESTIINLILENTLQNLDFYKSFDDKYVFRRDKGSFFKIRLQENVKDTLRNCEFDTPKCVDGQLTIFIKLILETYSSLSFFQREEIILLDLIKILNNKIDLKKPIRLFTAVNIGKAYDIIPLTIALPKEGTFRYLIGKKCDKKSPYVSIRLSIINRHIYHSSQKIDYPTIDEITILENDILEYGATFACEKKIKVLVKLNDSGAEDFLYSIIHRPIQINKENNIYEFYCSIKQIVYFFFRFCDKAEIIEPQNLREIFYELYKKGYEIYS